MDFVAYGFNLNARNNDTIRQMASIVTNQPIEIKDLRSFDPDAGEDSVVFFYGENPRVKEAKSRNYRVKVEFPEVELLGTDFGVEEERQIAYEKLLRLKEALIATDKAEVEALEGEQLAVRDEQQESTTIKEEELPQLSSTEVLRLLAKALKDNEIKEWIGVTQGGHQVRLALEPSHSAADINLTFAELYFIRASMEALQLKELKIVPKPNAYWKNSPWRSNS